MVTHVLGKQEKKNRPGMNTTCAIGMQSKQLQFIEKISFDAM